MLLFRDSPERGLERCFTYLSLPRSFVFVFMRFSKLIQNGRMMGCRHATSASFLSRPKASPLYALLSLFFLLCLGFYRAGSAVMSSNRDIVFLSVTAAPDSSLACVCVLLGQETIDTRHTQARPRAYTCFIFNVYE